MQVQAIVESYPGERRWALAILQDIQHEYNYIPEDALDVIHGHIGTPVAQLYSIATFYKALSLKPKGKHIIKVCDGTACHIRGSSLLVTGLKQLLDIDPGGRTEDGEFSLDCVHCLGSCALAPVMVVDETYHAQVTIEKLPAILESYRQGGGSDE